MLIDSLPCTGETCWCYHVNVYSVKLELLNTVKPLRGAHAECHKARVSKVCGALEQEGEHRPLSAARVALRRKELDRYGSDSLPCTPSTSANPWENVTFCDTSGLFPNYPSPYFALNGKWRCFLCALRGRMCPCPNSLCWAASGASCALPEVRLGWLPTAPSSCSLGQEALSGHNLLIDEFIICFPLNGQTNTIDWLACSTFLSTITDKIETPLLLVFPSLLPLLSSCFLNSPLFYDTHNSPKSAEFCFFVVPLLSPTECVTQGAAITICGEAWDRYFRVFDLVPNQPEGATVLPPCLAGCAALWREPAWPALNLKGRGHGAALCS